MPVKGPANGKGVGETDLDQDQSESGQGALGDDATTQEDASQPQEMGTAEADQDGQREGEHKAKVSGNGGQPGRSSSRPMKPSTKSHGQEQARAPPPVSDKSPVKLPHVGVKRGVHSRPPDAKKESFAAEKAALLASRRA